MVTFMQQQGDSLLSTMFDSSLDEPSKSSNQDMLSFAAGLRIVNLQMHSKSFASVNLKALLSLCRIQMNSFWVFVWQYS